MISSTGRVRASQWGLFTTLGPLPLEETGPTSGHYINKFRHNILPKFDVSLIQAHLRVSPHFTHRISDRCQNTHDPWNCAKKRISNQFVTRGQNVLFLCSRTCRTFITPVRAILSTVKYLSNKCNAAETNAHWRSVPFHVPSFWSSLTLSMATKSGLPFSQ